MWAKISSALKPRHVQEDEQQGDVISKVFEQHPNLSVFHPSDGSIPTPSPPSSPSRNIRRSIFKRNIRLQMDKDKDDVDESSSVPSLVRRGSIPRKMMSHFNIHGNSSQTSLSRGSADTSEHSKHPSESSRRSVQEIFHLLRPSPSLDPVRQQSLPSPQVLPLPASADNQSAEGSLASGLQDPRHSSVRSILRHPNTPGTGQNVRFFSRDAYRTISPDSSQEPDYQSLSPVFPDSSDVRGVVILNHGDSDALVSIFGHPDATGPASSSTPAAVVLARSASPGSHKARPSLSGVFSPLEDESQASHDAGRSLDRAGDRPIPAPDFNNILDTSGQMDDPPIPPGLGHEGDEGEGKASQTDDAYSFATAPSSAPALLTSSFSLQAKDKGKARASSESNDQHSLLLSAFEEKVFRPKERPPQTKPVHDRSHSFSFGQTVFFSVGSNGSSNNSNSSKGPASASSISPLTSMRPPFSGSDSSGSAPSPASLSKGRSRALSDTVFHSRAMSPTGHHPEVDADETSTELFSAQQAEPDPFSVHAKTYYTPQTMIPTTPPQRQHVRRTSKEESIIYSLQTQLTLQTELCGQYEADLRARDEMVEMLNNKLADIDKEENRKRTVLRTWKKKVQELEKAVRYLEEELDDSRQESMERSIMDEASGEALRELHRQIAGLEREKGEWTRTERTFKEEIGKLEHLVKEKTMDMEELKESLQKKDEDERQWQEDLREAKERIEMMDNRTLASIDEEELQKVTAEREQQKAIELERHRAAETHWQLEKTELSTRLESIQSDKGSMSEQLEMLRDQMKARDEEYSLLRAELEAQWQHTEKASEKHDALEKERAQLEMENKSLKRELATLEERAASLEVEWHESDGRRNEVESELQEVWNEKQALEKEHNQLEEQFQQEREQVDELTNALQERQDHITELEQEHKFAIENVSRLEENLRHRDQELSEYSIRVEQREAEIEQLREEMSALRRSHSHELDERTRKVHEVVEQAAEATAQLEESVRIKAELEVESSTNKDRVTSLKEEVDRLRKQAHSLQQDSADKEVKLVQMTKQLAQKEEDIAGLNIALDSKQQELELMKRRQGVRGIAGATPARPSKVPQRRDSSVFDSTPAAPRPSSVLSDSSDKDSMLGKHRKLPSDSTLTSSAIRISTLGKSTRVNAGAGSRASLRTDGSTGPPPVRPRVSTVASTPVSRPSSVSSQSSAAGKSFIAPLSSRRLSSGTLDRAQAKNTKTAPIASKGSTGNLNSSITSVSETEEKENIAVGKGVPVPT